MMNELRALTFLSVLVIFGCGGSNDTPSSRSVDTIDFTLTYMDSDSFTILDRLLPPGNRVLFSFIPGNVFGTPIPEYLIDASVDSTNTVGITIDKDIFTDSSNPEILSVEGVNNGLTVEPSDAKFGRLGTAVADAFGQFVPTGGGYGMYDGKSGLGFFIVYFDQAAVLSGSVQRIGRVTNYNIEIPEEGFFAVAGTQSEGSDGTVTEFSCILDLQNEAYFYIRSEQ